MDNALYAFSQSSSSPGTSSTALPPPPIPLDGEQRCSCETCDWYSRSARRVCSCIHAVASCSAAERRSAPLASAIRRDEGPLEPHGRCRYLRIWRASSSVEGEVVVGSVQESGIRMSDVSVRMCRFCICNVTEFGSSKYQMAMCSI